MCVLPVNTGEGEIAEPSCTAAVGKSLSCCVKRMIAAVRIALPSVNLPENLSRQPRHGAWLLIIVAAAAYYPRFVKLPAGMETYPQAAACLRQGQVLQVCDPGFTYPRFLRS